MFSYCKTLQKLLNCFQLFVLIAFGSAIIGGQFNYYYFSLSHQLVTDCFLYISRNLSLNHFWNLLAECMYIDIILSFYHLFVPVKYELCMSFLSYQVWTEHVILILSSENYFLSFLFCIQVSEMAIAILVLTELATCFSSVSGKDRQLNWHISGLVAHLLLPTGDWTFLTGDWTLGQRYIDNWTGIYCSHLFVRLSSFSSVS